MNEYIEKRATPFYVVGMEIQAMCKTLQDTGNTMKKH